MSWRNNENLHVSIFSFCMIIIIMSPLVRPNLVLPLIHLTSVGDNEIKMQDQDIHNALDIAVKEINQLKHLLPSVTLMHLQRKIKMKHNDSSFDEAMQSSAGAVLIGETLCDSIHQNDEKSWKKLTISYGCRNDEELSNKIIFPSILKVNPSNIQIVDKMLSMLQFYNWNHVSLVVQNTSKWRTMSETFLKRQIVNGINVTVVSSNHFEDTSLCCSLMRPCCNRPWSYDIFQRVKSTAKVHIFFGDLILLRQYIQTIEDVKFSKANQFLVISNDLEAFSEHKAVQFLQHHRIQRFNEYESSGHLGSSNHRSKENLTFSHLKEKSWSVAEPNVLDRLIKKSQAGTRPGLVMVVRNIASEHLIRFSYRVRLLSYMNATYSAAHQKNGALGLASIAAAYVYDAVLTYAHALSYLIKNKNLSSEQVAKLAKDGRTILDTIILMKNFSSVKGASISFDNNGYSEDSFIVAGSRHYFVPKNDFSKNSDINLLVQVGGFKDGNVYYSKEELHPIIQSRLTLSSDYDCEDDWLIEDHLTISIILAHLLATVGVIFTITYLAKKVEMKIESLLISDENLTENELINILLTHKIRKGIDFQSKGKIKPINVSERIKTLRFPFGRPAISRMMIADIFQVKNLLHENIDRFSLCILEPNQIRIVSEYNQTGESILDLLKDHKNVVRDRLLVSLVLNLINGMVYLHNSKLGFHGNLQSSNCLINANGKNLSIRITGFGFRSLRMNALDETDENKLYFDRLWKAPEMLRDLKSFGSQSGDVYSFAIILHELLFHQGPYAIDCGKNSAKNIVNLVITSGQRETPFRPPIEADGLPTFWLAALEDCWNEDPKDRPTFIEIARDLPKCIDSFARKRKESLQKNIDKIDQALHSVIPKALAEKLVKGENIEPELWENATIFQTDLIGFTGMASEKTPVETKNLLDTLYKLFDTIASGYDVYKVGTVGDAYIVVSGIHSTGGTHHAGEIASMALDIVSELSEMRIKHNGRPITIRIGVDSGSVTTGIIGYQSVNPSYSVFGKAVRMAALMEATGSEMKIQITENTYKELISIGGYITEERKDINVDSSSLKTYWLLGRTDKAVQRRPVNPSWLCKYQSNISLTNRDPFIDPISKHDV